MSHVIYLADDAEDVRKIVTYDLTQAGFSVQAFPDGDTLLLACEQAMPDLVILDILMPGTDGLSACSRLRQANAELPIIILSGKDSPFDRVTGFMFGSDDYLIKPFLPIELVARVRALLRRSQKLTANAESQRKLSFGPLKILPELRMATLFGGALTLTPTEFDFLAYLVKHQDRAVSRDELLKALWQMDWQADTRASDDLVKRLRRKLREQKSTVSIETVWGFGFRLALNEAPTDI